MLSQLSSFLCTGRDYMEDWRQISHCQPFILYNWKTFLGQWQLIFFCQPDTFDEPIWWRTFICKTLCWDLVFNFTFKFFVPYLPPLVFQMIFLWQEYALGCQSCLCSFKLIFGWWGLFVFKLGLVDSIHSKDGWQKLKWHSAIVSGWHQQMWYQCTSHGASNAGPSFQCCVGPASQVLLLLYGAERACSSGGQPSLDSFLRTRKTFMSFLTHLLNNLH